MQQTSDGGYIIAGRIQFGGAGGFDVYLIKTDPEGNPVWQKTLGGPYSESGDCVQQISDGGYIIAGNTDSYGAGQSDVYLIRLEAEEVPVEPLTPQDRYLPSGFSLHPVFPNPFNPTTTLSFTLPRAGSVRVEVFDINGRMMWAHSRAPLLSGSGTTPTTEFYIAGTHQITFDGSNLPSGIYFARMTVGEWVQVEKLVLLK